MPAFITIGFLKNDQVTNGGSITVGEGITQNRNATKQNLNNIGVGDALILQPIGATVNLDPDGADNTSLDAANLTGPQT